MQLCIVDSIEASEPVWAYWAFLMEHYCVSVVPAVRSHQFNFPSIDHHVTEVAQLIQIKMFCCLHNTLVLKVVKIYVTRQCSNLECERYGCFVNI